MKYKRVILKISGEALSEEGKTFSVGKIKNLIDEISPMLPKLELGIVIGAGNFFRGETLSHTKAISRIVGDQLGMMATILNGLFLQEIFHFYKLQAKLVSALGVDSLVERYNALKVEDYLSQGKVVIIAGGTGNPLVTTDTALCLRGIELKADLVLKATHKVEGVYSEDPCDNGDAQFYEHLSYDLAIQKGLGIMDQAAFFLGKNYGLRLAIYNFNKVGALAKILRGEKEGTIIESEEKC